jgi:autotransporter translocation and assembly factor TamB
MWLLPKMPHHITSSNSSSGSARQWGRPLGAASALLLLLLLLLALALVVLPAGLAYVLSWRVRWSS